MNADEFIAAVNQARPPHLPPADRDFLRQHELILGPHTYYKNQIPSAIHLLGLRYEFLDKVKQQTTTKPTAGKAKTTLPEVKPQIAISQIVVIHNSDTEQCHCIRNGLIQTELIHNSGPIFINFSPYTGQTINSLGSEAFKEADYVLECASFEKTTSEGKTKPLGWSTSPVLFTKDVAPTLVQLTYVLGGQRQPSIGPGAPVPSPLYQAFLNVNTDSAQEIMDFMNTYKVYPFVMHLDPQQLINYISHIEKSIKLILGATEGKLRELCADEQQKMRGILVAATQGKLEQMVLPPAFPLCEEATAKWNSICGYFDQKLVETTLPDETRFVLLDFGKDETPSGRVRIRRFYGWFDYMWAELLDDIWRENAALICEKCGRVISRGKHGRPKRFCSQEDAPECYKARKAQHVSASRSKKMCNH
jgi:hypothetical protein